MKHLSRRLQRLYILGFLLFAWHIDPFARFTPAFPLAWSLLLIVAAYVVPNRPPTGSREAAAGQMALQALLVGALAGLTVGAADWSQLDLTLLFACAWALMPLFLFDRLFRWAWRSAAAAVSAATARMRARKTRRQPGVRPAR